MADWQTSGMGSRDNRWDSVEGNLFFSFVLNREQLPGDLELASSSIYFGYVLKETLEKLGSKAWLKWPNDIYLGDKKIGGIITGVTGKKLICGIGLNLVASENHAALDIDLDKKKLIESFWGDLKMFPSWKKIFSKFRVEFEKSKQLNSHANGQKISLEKALLECDGSLTINGKRVYSLR